MSTHFYPSRPATLADFLMVFYWEVLQYKTLLEEHVLIVFGCFFSPKPFGLLISCVKAVERNFEIKDFIIILSNSKI